MRQTRRTATDPTTEFFERLAERGHEPLLGRANGTLRFELKDGTRSQRWLVAVNRGDVTVSRKGGDADCVVVGSKALFDRLFTGKANALAALLRGELAAEGDFNLLVIFQRVLPGPRRKRKRMQTAERGRTRA